MQLDPRFQERLAVIVTVIIGMVGAVMLGKMTAQGQTGTIAMIVCGVIGIASLLHFRERVWVLIPVLWPLYGAVPLLPVPLSVKHIAVLVATGAIIVCIAVKIIRKRPRFDYLDSLLWLNALWLLTAFVRNPTGFLISDSERVGGRPYIDALIGMMAWWTLVRLEPSPNLLRRIPAYTVTSVGVIFFINVLAIRIPIIGDIAGNLYTGFDFSMMETEDYQSVGANDGSVRYEIFRDIGKYSIYYLCAFYFPPTLLNPINWGRFGWFSAAMLGLLLSGFRSFVIAAGAMFLLGSYFQKGLASAARSLIIGAVLVYTLMLGHGTVYELPFAAQRALAFVPERIRPTQLNENAIEAGESSTDWRVEMWIQALTTNRYITDKFLGDGFGMTKMQVAIIQSIGQVRARSFQETQEHMAVSGDFHSGPISTIRVVGYVGLGIFYMLLIPMAFHAARLIGRCKGTPLFGTAMFFCLPIVFEPFWFTFIFGGFNMAIPFVAFSVGIMKVIENSLANLRIAKSNPVLGPLQVKTPLLAQA